MSPIDELHPLLVHFPIALFAAAFFCDSLGLILQKKSLTSAGCWNLLLALIASIFTIISGYISDSLVGHMEEPFPIFSTHGSLQILSVLWLLSIAVFRWKMFERISRENRLKWIYVIMFGVGVMFLFYGSHLGAKLANRF